MAEELIYKVKVTGTDQVKKLEKAVTEAGNPIRRTTNYMQDMNRELEVMRGEMMRNVVGSDKYNRALARASEIQTKLNDTNKKVNAGVRDLGQTTKNITGTMVGMAGGFQVVQSAMSLFGIENEETIKTVLKLQQTMSIVQGMASFAQGISNAQDLLANFRASNNQTIEVAADLSGSMDNTGKSMDGASDSAEGLSDTVIETSSNLAGATNAADETSKGMGNLNNTFKGLTGRNKDLMDSLSATGGKFTLIKDSIAKTNVKLLENDLAILKSGEDFESLNNITDKVIKANGGHEKSIESIIAAMEKEIDLNKAIVESEKAKVKEQIKLNTKTTKSNEELAKAYNEVGKSSEKGSLGIGNFTKSIVKSLATMGVFLLAI